MGINNPSLDCWDFIASDIADKYYFYEAAKPKLKQPTDWRYFNVSSQIQRKKKKKNPNGISHNSAEKRGAQECKVGGNISGEEWITIGSKVNIRREIQPNLVFS